MAVSENKARKLINAHPRLSKYKIKEREYYDIYHSPEWTILKKGAMRVSIDPSFFEDRGLDCFSGSRFYFEVREDRAYRVKRNLDIHAATIKEFIAALDTTADRLAQAKVQDETIKKVQVADELAGTVAQNAETIKTLIENTEYRKKAISLVFRDAPDNWESVKRIKLPLGYRAIPKKSFPGFMRVHAKRISDKNSESMGEVTIPHPVISKIEVSIVGDQDLQNPSSHAWIRICACTVQPNKVWSPRRKTYDVDMESKKFYQDGNEVQILNSGWVLTEIRKILKLTH